ncbi:hypothetical protein KORDIASMS9_04002 [Kordia sp. SMS9]|uniref:DUF4252 domain-containing protein n=1 Tax=Kordia sp. SMS9 TaxID=2282170 RepID=UPI000E0DF121|nr:DUF4252 domain-containing protein [Kordia sp. SMS9]AXG71745.1 hypothetical protein KORDIASMS9_04002 [Kordia sp. SMS9]
MKTFSSFLLLLCIGVAITSCSDKNSLQNYFIDHAEQSGFSSSTIPISLLRQDGIQLSEKQEEALDAIDRINLLFYRTTPEKQTEFTSERKNIKTILKNKKYEELMNLGNKGVVKYIGTDTAMDEIVIFLSNQEMGFAVTRIIGDNMTIEKFMELYKLTQQRNTPLNFDLTSITKLMGTN